MTQQEKQEEIKVLVNVLFSEYKSLTISPTETSRIIKRSEISLKRDREESTGMAFMKLGKQNGSDKIFYSIYDVAKFIVSRKRKVR